jgi:probable HAF family extracellular repeat protein
MNPASVRVVAFFCSVPCVAAAAPMYSVRPIEGPPEVDVVEVASINDLGQATGTLVRFNQPNRAFFWDGSGPVQLIPVDNAHGAAINNRGEVVGISNDGPFIWSAAGGLRPLPVPAGYTEFQPFAINDAGTIAGAVFAAGERAGTARVGADGSAEVNSDLLLRNWFSASINRHGAVAGTALGPQFNGPIVWEADGPVRQLPGGDAFDVNDLGAAVGTASGGGAYWRPDGTLVGIPDMAGAEVSTQTPYGLNNAGQVVGYLNHTNHANDAFFWTEADGTLDLQDLLDESGEGWDLEFAVDINEPGQIVGRASNTLGLRAAFLLTPVPEPGAGALSFACATALLRRRRQRPTSRCSTGSPE